MIIVLAYYNSGLP